MSEVHAELKYVLNLGNYETLHITVGVTDSPRGGEKVSEAFDRVYKYVEETLTEKVKAAQDELDEQNAKE